MWREQECHLDSVLWPSVWLPVESPSACPLPSPAIHNLATNQKGNKSETQYNTSEDQLTLKRERGPTSLTFFLVYNFKVVTHISLISSSVAPNSRYQCGREGKDN